MSNPSNKSNPSISYQKAFTLIEVLIVVTILGILAAIAIPNYNKYVKNTKRTDMMAELIKVSANIESQSLANGSYRDVKVQDIFTENMDDTGRYPNYNPLYQLTVTPTRTERVIVNGQTENKLFLDGGNWTIQATPINTNQMHGDGFLSIDHKGKKCHVNKCSLGNEWK